MLLTSKEADKLLKQLENQKELLLIEEEQSKFFLASVGENVEDCRPEYDFKKMQEEILNIETKIISLKHQINIFNISTKVIGYDMTIDQMLVYIPQLTQKKNKLGSMQNVLPKTREMSSMRSSIIDYRYANYDIKAVKEAYAAISEELSNAQIALDKTNISLKFDVII